MAAQVHRNQQELSNLAFLSRRRFSAFGTAPRSTLRGSDRTAAGRGAGGNWVGVVSALLNPSDSVGRTFAAGEEEIAVFRTRAGGVFANLNIRDLEREAADLPFADVGIALHVGEVLYGNVGAVDRLDFTVIGPAVNEVVRMEKLCEPLGQQILFSSRFAEAAGRCDGRLESLGHFQLRGVDEAKEIFGLRLSQTAALQRVEA